MRGVSSYFVFEAFFEREIVAVLSLFVFWIVLSLSRPVFVFLASALH